MSRHYIDLVNLPRYHDFVDSLEPLSISALPEDATCPICQERFHNLLPAVAESADIHTHSFFAHLPFALPFGLPNTSELDLPVRLPCTQAQHRARLLAENDTQFTVPDRARRERRNRNRNGYQDRDYTQDQDSAPVQGSTEDAVNEEAEGPSNNTRPAQPNHILGLSCLRAWFNTGLPHLDTSEGSCPLCRVPLFTRSRSRRLQFYMELSDLQEVPHRTHVLAHRHVPDWHSTPDIIPRCLPHGPELKGMLAMMMIRIAETMERDGARLTARGRVARAAYKQQDWVDVVWSGKKTRAWEEEWEVKKLEKGGCEHLRRDMEELLRETALDAQGRYPVWARVLMDADTERVIDAVVNAVVEMRNGRGRGEENMQVTPGALATALMRIIESTISPAPAAGSEAEAQDDSASHSSPEVKHLARLKQVVYTNAVYGWLNLLRELEMVREKMLADKNPFPDSDENSDLAIFDDMSDMSDTDDAEEPWEASDTGSMSPSVHGDTSTVTVDVGAGRLTVHVDVEWIADRAAQGLDVDGDSQMFEVEDAEEDAEEDADADADADDEGEGREDRNPSGGVGGGMDWSGV